MATPAATEAPTSPARRRGRAVRALGSFMALAGIALLVWCFVVWQWNDPFTALYTRWEQRKLDAKYAEVVVATRDRPAPIPVEPHASVAELERAVSASDKRFRHETREGMPIGLIIVPRLHGDEIGVDDPALGREEPRMARLELELLVPR